MLADRYFAQPGPDVVRFVKAGKLKLAADWYRAENTWTEEDNSQYQMRHEVAMRHVTRMTWKRPPAKPPLVEGGYWQVGWPDGKVPQ